MVPSLWNALACAAAAPATGAPAAGATDKPGLNPMILMFTVIIILFYFIMLRPQKAEQRKREEMLNSLAKGDSVLTNGGIYGTVESFDKEKGIVTVAVAPKVVIKFTRSAITSVTRKKDKSESDAE